MQYFDDIKERYQSDAQIKIAYAWRKYAVSELVIIEKEREDS